MLAHVCERFCRCQPLSLIQDGAMSSCTCIRYLGVGGAATLSERGECPKEGGVPWVQRWPGSPASFRPRYEGRGFGTHCIPTATLVEGHGWGVLLFVLSLRAALQQDARSHRWPVSYPACLLFVGRAREMLPMMNLQAGCVR